MADGADVTLVVPTYKRPEYLAECLASIVGQHYRRYLVLVCDNSPEQEARSVVEHLQDDRFIYCPRPQNLGIFGNAVQGFLDVNTPWVMEVDDDDLLHPHCLSLLMAPLENDPSLTLSFGNVDLIDERGLALPPQEQNAFLRLDRGIAPGRHAPFTCLAIQGLIYMVATVLRHDAVDWAKIPSQAGPAYDRYLGIAAAAGGAAAYYITEPVMAYRVHDSADTIVHESRQYRGGIAALTAAHQFVPPASERLYQEELAYHRLLLIRALFQEGRLAEANRVARGMLTPVSGRAAFDAVSSSYRRHDSLNGLIAYLTRRGRRRGAVLSQ